MNKIKASVALALGIGSSLAAVTSPASAGWTNPGYYRGGFVKPCSLDGVNPVYHPYIFGNPALALQVYGFVQARDGSWHVIPNCHIYN